MYVYHPTFESSIAQFLTLLVTGISSSLLDLSQLRYKYASSLPSNLPFLITQCRAFLQNQLPFNVMESNSRSRGLHVCRTFENLKRKGKRHREKTWLLLHASRKTHSGCTHVFLRLDLENTTTSSYATERTVIQAWNITPLHWITETSSAYTLALFFRKAIPRCIWSPDRKCKTLMFVGRVGTSKEGDTKTMISACLERAKNGCDTATCGSLIDIWKWAMRIFGGLGVCVCVCGAPVFAVFIEEQSLWPQGYGSAFAPENIVRKRARVHAMTPKIEDQQEHVVLCVLDELKWLSLSYMCSAKHWERYVCLGWSTILPFWYFLRM